MDRIASTRATCALFALALAHATSAAAQSGGFVAQLGRDTVHVETFTRHGDSLNGTIVTRIPVTRIEHYTMTFDHNNHPLHYSYTTSNAAGVLLTNDATNGSYTWLGDSVIRETVQKGAMVSQRIAAPKGAFPSPLLPYTGVSFLMYEMALADGRKRSPGAAEGEVGLLTLYGGQATPEMRHAWFVSADSSELDYFGVARSGYRFDKQGHLIRADWTGTTYRYHITRTAPIDVMALSRAWAQLDAAGKGIGAVSPRDSAKGTVGSADLTFDYSRPSARGRNIWGDVVTPGVVWRLGADKATHFTTSHDIVIGTTAVPAGRYTLWMLYAPDNTAQLIISKSVNVWGTSYDARQDFAHIPMTRHDGISPAEQLTVGVDGSDLRIAWGSVAWTVPIQSQ